MITPTAPSPRALELPCTGQTLRLALAQRDLRTLDELTRHLRVAGYRFEPLALAAELLAHGCASVADAFGHRVAVHVRVPRRAAMVPRDESQAFTIAL
ncbi:MAG: hypothetical protein ACOZJX_06905 [Pseudomonadota bacterium]